MPASLRVYRQRIRSVNATKKITRAQELIAASRIVKAQQRVHAASPYARELTKAVSAVATFSNVDHPLTTEKSDRRRAAVVIITSDRGMAGAYSANVLRESERLIADLRQQNVEVLPYLVGRKGVAFYRFRQRSYAADWTGFSEQPTYRHAKEVADRVISDFLQPTEEGGVDEIHLVFTEFVNMVTQRPEIKRLLPLEVVEDVEPPKPGEIYPLYEFEPSAEAVLDALLPRYVESRVYYAMLTAAASEQAARQRAMKSATDNAEELVRNLTRLANQARQAAITQEISEIVGGADALASANAGNE